MGHNLARAKGGTSVPPFCFTGLTMCTDNGIVLRSQRQGENIVTYETPKSCQRVGICNYLNRYGPANTYAIAEDVFPGDHALIQRQLDSLRAAGALWMPDGVTYALRVRIEGAGVYELDPAGLYEFAGYWYSPVASTFTDPVITFWTWVQLRITEARRLLW